MVLTRVDSKGRVLIPKSLREAVGLREGEWVELEVEDGAVKIRPVKSVGDAYFGVFKVEHWPEDLDTFLVEAVRRAWREAT
mgnify:CR=1 FL=1